MADQLTLSEPERGRADYAHKIILPPPDFQTFLRPYIKITVAINELLCMKNAGAQIAMDFS